MASNDVFGFMRRGDPGGNDAWKVSLTAAARRVAMTENGADYQAAALQVSSNNFATASAPAVNLMKQLSPVDARDVWVPNLLGMEPSKPRSVWLVVGGIWISSVLVAAGVIEAMLFLLG